MRNAGRRLPLNGSMVLAAVLLIVSLGMPWSRTVTAGLDVSHSLLPGTCTTMVDGSLDCTGMTWVPGWSTGSQVAVGAGYDSGARVGLVLALVAILMAYRRSNPTLLLGVPAGVGLAVVAAGLTGFAGQLLALAACVVVAPYTGLLRARSVGGMDHRT